MEGHWETQACAPLLLFGIPDNEAEETHYEIGIPCLGGLILTHSFTKELKGLKEFLAEDRPPRRRRILVFSHHGRHWYGHGGAGDLVSMAALATDVV